MEIHNHILDYFNGLPFTDEKAEPQARFNILKRKIDEVTNFLFKLNASRHPNTDTNQIRLDVLRGFTTTILEEMQAEFNGLPAIEIKPSPPESSNYKSLSAKNQGKD